MIREKPLLLPRPLSSEWFWQQMASCRQTDTEVFYVADASSIKVAKDLCGGCVVMRECREYAVIANEPHGIWGGLTPAERAQQRWYYSARSSTLARPAGA